jgi:N-acetylglucosamine-6-sulfatase
VLAGLTAKRLRAPTAVVAALAAVAFAASLDATPRAAAQAPAQRPNIVFVLTDDLAWNLVPYMPHVQALERSGMTFTRYFVTDSLCCPSRSSILSGRFPHDTGVYSNTGLDGGFNVFHGRGEEGQTFATALQGAGYRTALMGKYLNGYKPGAALGGTGPYVPPGWSEWDVAGNGYRGFDYKLNENGSVVRYGRGPSDYLTDVIAGRGTSFIHDAAAAGAPFMLELATFAPHAPFVPAPRDRAAFPGLAAPRSPAFGTANANPPRWLRGLPPLSPRQTARIDRDFRRRAESVQAIDDMIGRIEAELAADGVAQNTYIVFSSDNGLHMGEHRLMPGKLTAFDSDVRVPLIVAGPGVPAGQASSQLAENVDLAPTFAELGGTSMPSDVDGHSLAPLLAGASPDSWRQAVLIEHRHPARDVNDPDLAPAHSGNPDTYEALRTADSLYVEYANGEREYYDLRSDPFELVNIAGSLAPARLAALHAALAAVENCHDGSACWAAEQGGGTPLTWPLSRRQWARRHARAVRQWLRHR